MRQKKSNFPSRLLRLLPESLRSRVEWLVRVLEADPLTEMNRAQRILARNVRVVFLVARIEVIGKLKLHAQALTYATLLSMIPALAVVFAILKGFGATEGVAAKVQGLLVSQVSGTPELQQTLGEYIQSFTSNINAGQIGIVSIIILVWSVLTLLSHIENSFNDVFGVREQRPFATRMLTYWAVLTFGPLLLLASFALSAWFQTSRMADLINELGSISAFLVSAVPLGVTYIGFFAMYLFVPNTRVRWGPALFAAVTAGSAWNLAKYGYAIYAKNAITLQNIYGSLAVIPLFIVWLYVSWVLVLFGAQLAYAFQNSKTYRPEDERTDASHAFLERAGLRLFLEVARDFSAGRTPTRPEQLAAKLRIPRRLLDRLLERLREGGLLRLTDAHGGLVPGLPLEKATVKGLLDFLCQDVGTAPSLVHDEGRAFIDELLGEIDGERQRIAGSITFKELAERFAPPVGRVDTDADAEAEDEADDDEDAEPQRPGGVH